MGKSKIVVDERRFKSYLVTEVLINGTSMRWCNKRFEVIDCYVESQGDTVPTMSIIGKGPSMYEALRDAYKRQGKAYTEEEIAK